MFSPMPANTVDGEWIPRKPKKIGKITEQDLKDVVTAAYKKGLSKKMLSNIRNTMMSFIKYCRINKCSSLRPEGIKIPYDAPESNKKPIQPADIKKLFANSGSTWRCKLCEDRLIHAYRFIVAVGLRPGELIGLQRINIEGNVIKIRGSINKYNDTTKGKNRRAIRTYKIGRIALSIWEEQQAMLKRDGIVSTYAFQTRTAALILLFILKRHGSDTVCSTV